MLSLGWNASICDINVYLPIIAAKIWYLKLCEVHFSEIIVVLFAPIVWPLLAIWNWMTAVQITRCIK